MDSLWCTHSLGNFELLKLEIIERVNKPVRKDILDLSSPFVALKFANIIYSTLKRRKRNKKETQRKEQRDRNVERWKRESTQVESKQIRMKHTEKCSRLYHSFIHRRTMFFKSLRVALSFAFGFFSCSTLRHCSWVSFCPSRHAEHFLY